MASIEFLGTNKTHALFDIVGVPSSYRGKYVTWYVYESTSSTSYVKRTTFPIQSGQTTYRASVQLKDGRSYKYTEAWISSSSTPNSSADCDEILIWNLGVFSINKDRYLSVDSSVGNEVEITIHGMSSSYSHQERTVSFLPNKSSSNVLSNQPITMENGFTEYSFTIELEEDQTYDLMQAEISYYTNSDNTDWDFVYLATECDINTESGALSDPIIDNLYGRQKEDGSKTLICIFRVSNLLPFSVTSASVKWSTINIYVNSVRKCHYTEEDLDKADTGYQQIEIPIDNYGDIELRLEAINMHENLISGTGTTSSWVSKTYIVKISAPNYTLNCTWSTKTIIDEYGHELICANYPHITAANWKQFCEDINTLRSDQASLSNYNFTPIQRGDLISSGLWNELVEAICSIDGSDTTLYIVHPNNKLITPERVSALEGKLQDICDLYY